MAQTWLGPIFLKEEGGYQIVLRALNHYKKRLETIGSSPELSQAPMFVQIVQMEAQKTHPKIKQIINQLNQGLENPEILKNLQNEIPSITKALDSYQSDLQKATKKQHPYYVDLIPNSESLQEDFPQIRIALEKINQFS